MLISTFTFTIEASGEDRDQVERAIAAVCDARAWGAAVVLPVEAHSDFTVAVAVTVAVPNRSDAVDAFQEALPGRNITVT